MTKNIDLIYWNQFVDSLDVKPLFVTVSGAHAYGFPSDDSDVDLRGAHTLPLRSLIGLALPCQTYEKDGMFEGTEIDIVSHEIGKYFGLLVKNNGYILEQVFSPLVVCGQDFLDQLRPIADRCITRHHYHHYRGFYKTQRGLIEKQSIKKAKSVLYAYRVLMTGIHLMNTGEVRMNVHELNDSFKLPYLADLVASKVTEKAAPADLDWAFHSTELDRLESKLDSAFEESKLPENRDRKAVNEWLIELRLSAIE